MMTKANILSFAIVFKTVSLIMILGAATAILVKEKKRVPQEKINHTAEIEIGF